jgi:hypothetical protein
VPNFALAPDAQTLLVLAFTFAPVAQLDRAPDYESGGWGFDSLRVHQFFFARRWAIDGSLGARRANRKRQYPNAKKPKNQDYPQCIFTEGNKGNDATGVSSYQTALLLPLMAEIQRRFVIFCSKSGFGGW